MISQTKTPSHLTSILAMGLGLDLLGLDLLGLPTDLLCLDLLGLDLLSSLGVDGNCHLVGPSMGWAPLLGQGGLHLRLLRRPSFPSFFSLSSRRSSSSPP